MDESKRKRVKKMRFTPTREHILQFIPKYYFDHLYMPTSKEISDAVGVSVNTVQAHMHRLLNLGMLDTDLPIHNELGECSRTAWASRGYRFGMFYPREYRYLYNLIDKKSPDEVDEDEEDETDGS